MPTTEVSPSLGPEVQESIASPPCEAVPTPFAGQGGLVAALPSSGRLGRPPELVKKITTSGASVAITPTKKRRTAARRKFRPVLRAQRRMARAHNLYAVSITLTYVDDRTHQSKDLSALMQAIRAYVRRRVPGVPVSYLWTLDRGDGGVLHYHLLIWLPRDVSLPPDRLEKWWTPGRGSTWRARTKKPSCWVRYITKPTAARFPKGARLYGYGGLDDAGRLSVQRAGWPRWLQRLIPAGEHAKRLSGAGWVHLETGSIYESPYVWTPRGVKLKPILPLWWVLMPTAGGIR